MRLLILTQAIDLDDPVLGFFHGWVVELAKRYEFVNVICLKEGRQNLPANVRVYSLGKEGAHSRWKYVLRFYGYVWKLRHQYDAVFVHMNQEYMVLGGLLWRLIGKRIYFWRNYHGGTWLTEIAIALANKVFCTSVHSYTAGRAKTILMPVGVDTELFFPDARVSRVPNSILFLSGMWPSKRPELLIDALAILRKKGISFSADFYGSPLPVTVHYYESLKERVKKFGIADAIVFYPGIPNSMTPDIYRSREIFVNCSPSGMFDKTLFEAAASGCRVLSSSEDFATLAGPDTYFDSAETLAQQLAAALGDASPVPSFVTEHSLHTLGARLAAAIH